jgi:hypothetical protein
MNLSQQVLTFLVTENIVGPQRILIGQGTSIGGIDGSFAAMIPKDSKAIHRWRSSSTILLRQHSIPAMIFSCSQVDLILQ